MGRWRLLARKQSLYEHSAFSSRENPQAAFPHSISEYILKNGGEISSQKSRKIFVPLLGVGG